MRPLVALLILIIIILVIDRQNHPAVPFLVQAAASANCPDNAPLWTTRPDRYGYVPGRPHEHLYLKDTV